MIPRDSNGYIETATLIRTARAEGWGTDQMCQAMSALSDEANALRTNTPEYIKKSKRHKQLTLDAMFASRKIGRAGKRAKKTRKG